MKMALSWKLNSELAGLIRRHNLRIAVSIAARLSLLTLIVGYGFWLLALWYINLPLPKRLVSLVHWLLIGHGLLWWLLPLSLLRTKTYRLTRFGVGDKQWSRWVGYSIEAHPLSAKHTVVRLWNQDRISSADLPLPDDDRFQRLIVRFVGRHVPRLDLHDEADEIRKAPPVVPAWFVPLTAACSMLHGVILGFITFNLHVRFGLSGDWLMLVALCGSFTHFGWIPTWLLGRTDQYRRIRSRLYTMAAALILLSVLTAIITLVVMKI